MTQQIRPVNDSVHHGHARAGSLTCANTIHELPRLRTRYGSHTRQGSHTHSRHDTRLRGNRTTTQATLATLMSSSRQQKRAFLQMNWSGEILRKHKDPGHRGEYTVPQTGVTGPSGRNKRPAPTGKSSAVTIQATPNESVVFFSDLTRVRTWNLSVF